MNSQSVQTGRFGARETVLAAIAANVPVVWLLDGPAGYAIVCPNGASDPVKGSVTAISVLSASDGVRAIATLQKQWPAVITVRGNAGFANAFNTYSGATAVPDNDIGDSQAASAAVATALANSGLNVLRVN